MKVALKLYRKIDADRQTMSSTDDIRTHHLSFQKNHSILGAEAISGSPGDRACDLRSTLLRLSAVDLEVLGVFICVP